MFILKVVSSNCINNISLYLTVKVMHNHRSMISNLGLGCPLIDVLGIFLRTSELKTSQMTEHLGAKTCSERGESGSSQSACYLPTMVCLLISNLPAPEAMPMCKPRVPNSLGGIPSPDLFSITSCIS